MLPSHCACLKVKGAYHSLYLFLCSLGLFEAIQSARGCQQGFELCWESQLPSGRGMYNISLRRWRCQCKTRSQLARHAGSSMGAGSGTWRSWKGVKFCLASRTSPPGATRACKSSPIRTRAKGSMRGTYWKRWHRRQQVGGMIGASPAMFHVCVA